jgi:hypothetical protein
MHSLLRNPDSKATEKQEVSLLNDVDRAKGPEDESRMGRVFIAIVCYLQVG